MYILLANVVWQLADDAVMLGHQECIVGSLCISAHLRCSAAWLMVMIAVIAPVLSWGSYSYQKPLALSDTPSTPVLPSQSV